MEPAPDGEGWQLVVLILGVNNELVEREAHEVLHSQDLGGDILGGSGQEKRETLPGWKEGHKFMSVIKYNRTDV